MIVHRVYSLEMKLEYFYVLSLKAQILGSYSGSIRIISKVHVALVWAERGNVDWRKVIRQDGINFALAAHLVLAPQHWTCSYSLGRLERGDILLVTSISWYQQAKTLRPQAVNSNSTVQCTPWCCQRLFLRYGIFSQTCRIWWPIYLYGQVFHPWF